MEELHWDTFIIGLGERVWRCLVCGHILGTARGMERHLAKKHGLDMTTKEDEA